jgi:hypothetical protein
MIVSGLVKDAKTDTPHPGAKVSLYIGTEELAVISSDDRGEFTHSVDASYIGKTLTCRVEKEGYKTKKETKKVEQDEVHLEIELTPEETQQIEFSLNIKDSKGNPLNGVRVSLDLDTEQVGSGRSDENGLFKMTLRPDLGDKTLEYTAKRLLYKTETGQIQIEKETSAEITMKKIVFPLWAKIAAGIVAAVIVVAIVIYCINGRKEPPKERPNLELVSLGVSPTKTRDGARITLKYELKLEKMDERVLPTFKLAATVAKRSNIHAIDPNNFRRIRRRIRTVGGTTLDPELERIDLIDRRLGPHREVVRADPRLAKLVVPVPLHEWELKPDKWDELESKGKITDTQIVRIPSGLEAGTWVLWVRADVKGDVEESKEGDNVKSRRIAIVD